MSFDDIPDSALQGPAIAQTPDDRDIPSAALASSTPTPPTPAQPSITDLANQNFDATLGTARRMAKGTAAAVIGGYGAIESVIGDLATGKAPDMDKAAGVVEDVRNRFLAGDTATTPREIEQQQILQSPKNPINWPSELGAKAGELEGKLGGGPALQTGVDVAANLGSTLLGVKALGAGASALRAPATEASSAAAPAAIPRGAPPANFDSVPVEGGVPNAVQTARAQVLQRIGLDKARNSAIEGDAKSAATDFQLTKFDEPAGVEAKAQFDAEKAALQQHAEGIVNDTGGTLGTDEDSLSQRGQTIAKPFDQLRQWFDTQKQALYGAADKRAQGAPVGDVSQVDDLLKNPDFTETLLAKDQGGLLGSVQRQWDRFKALNPGGIEKQGDVMVGDQGMTVANAENFRKWLNQVWTPQNSQTLGQVKGALDNSVLKGAGEDIYGPARSLAQMEYQTLDNPNGVSRLMDVDPKSPLNRTTPYVKIPDAITRLDPDQFANVFKTLDTMPEGIQPAALAAKSEIKAHLANKLVDAGSSTQGQWNAPAVSKVLSANSAKLQTAFEDQPEVLSKISDLDSAGKILKVNQSYPGAAAQAANALKRGMMSRVISKASAATGALVGSGAGALVGAPGLGAAAGAGLGESVGSSLGQGMSERSALNRWNANTVTLSDLLKRASQ